MPIWFNWLLVASVAIAIVYALIRELGNWGHPNNHLNGSNHTGPEPDEGNPARTLVPAQEKGWHPQEGRHRSYERKYWLLSLGLSFAVAVGAGASAWFAHDAAIEAGKQVTASLTANKLNAEISRAWISGPDFVNGKFVFKNVGLKPTVGFVLDMQPINAGVYEPSVIANICAHLKTEHGATLPPYSAIPSTNWLVDVVNIPSHDLFKGFPETIHEGDRIRIVGCAIYRISSGPEIHQTGFVVLLSKQGGSVGMEYSYTEYAD